MFPFQVDEIETMPMTYGKYGIHCVSNPTTIVETIKNRAMKTATILSVFGLKTLRMPPMKSS